MLTTVMVAVAVAALTSIYFIMSRRRRIPELSLNEDAFADVKTSLTAIAGLSGGSLCENNSAKIYQNGHLLDAMLSSIDDATDTVHFETYIWEPGRLEQRVVDALSAKAQQGVRVRVLIDAVGGMNASKSALARLRDAGAQVSFYHPIKRYSLRRFNNRTHRKLLVVDGERALVFGHGVCDTWCGHAQDEQHWRDTGIMLRGSVVCPLQIIFAQDWLEATGSPLIGGACFRGANAQGPVSAHVSSSSTRGGHSSVALLYMLAIATSRSEIIIQNPYFAPAPVLVGLLTGAARRGVSVHLMVPGKTSDSRLLRRAGRHLYEQLLEAGVHIYEYEKTLLHQKIVIVDRVWSHIGSTNFDARSLALNAEVGVGLLDSGLAEELHSAFLADLDHCREHTLKDWRQRSRLERWLDHSAYMVRGQI